MFLHWIWKPNTWTYLSRERFEFQIQNLFIWIFRQWIKSLIPITQALISTIDSIYLELTQPFRKFLDVVKIKNCDHYCIRRT